VAFSRIGSVTQIRQPVILNGAKNLGISSHPRKTNAEILRSAQNDRLAVAVGFMTLCF
jgi:hypothetical protein